MTAIRQKTFEKGQWSIVCSNYLEIPVGKSENNSRYYIEEIFIIYIYSYYLFIYIDIYRTNSYYLDKFKTTFEQLKKLRQVEKDKTNQTQGKL